MLSGLLSALSLVVVTDRNVKTFERDIPLAVLTQEIQVHLYAAQGACWKFWLETLTRTSMRRCMRIWSALLRIVRRWLGEVAATSERGSP